MSNSKKSFFSRGEAPDPGYRNVRDSPNSIRFRKKTEELWRIYQPLADKNFLPDAKTHFLERFWEMYLGATLKSNGFNLINQGSEGPEFFFELEGKKVWFEATAPGPGTGKDKVPEPYINTREDFKNNQVKVYSVPQEKVILRLTSALENKRNKYQKDLEKGIISVNDYFVLAINGQDIPHCSKPGIDPFILQAVYPIGHPAVDINVETLEWGDLYRTRREHLPRESGSDIPTTAFLNERFEGISGVLFSNVDAGNYPERLGDWFIFVHNFMAKNPLPKRFFGFAKEYYWENRGLWEIT